MNGLMNASVSLGSSHLLARVTWMPHVSVPSGAAAAGVRKAPSSESATSAASAGRRRGRVMRASSPFGRLMVHRRGGEPGGVEGVEIERGSRALRDELGQGEAGARGVQHAPRPLAGRDIRAPRAVDAADPRDAVLPDRAV